MLWFFYFSNVIILIMPRKMAKNKNQHKPQQHMSQILPKPFLSQITPLLLRFLIIVILIGLAAGIVKTFYDLQMIFHKGVEETMRQLLLNVITLLAVVEVVKTAMSYLTDGRVKVTYIVDTVLIVMLNEIISLWFKGPNINQVILLSIIIMVLILVRLLAIKFSPDTD